MSSDTAPPAMGVLTHCGSGRASPGDGHHHGSPRGMSPNKGGYSTATIARTRPKMPHLAQRCSTLSPERISTHADPSKTKVENLEEAFSDLGNIDFVSKYSRNRRRSGTASPLPSASQPLSPMSPLTSPGLRTPPTHSEAGSGATVHRMHSLRLKLVQVKESQDRAEKAGQGLKNIPPRRLGVVSLPTPTDLTPTTGRKSMPVKAWPSSHEHSNKTSDGQIHQGGSSPLRGRDSSEEKSLIDPQLDSPLHPPRGSAPGTPAQGNNGQANFQRAWSEPTFITGSRNRQDDNSEEEMRESGPETPPVSFTKPEHWQQRRWEAAFSHRQKDPINRPVNDDSSIINNQTALCENSRPKFSQSLERSMDASSMSDLSKCSSTSTLKETTGSDEECLSRAGSMKKPFDGQQSESIDRDLINVIPEIEKTYGASPLRRMGEFSHESSSSVDTSSYSDQSDQTVSKVTSQIKDDKSIATTTNTESSNQGVPYTKLVEKNQRCSDLSEGSKPENSDLEGVDEGVGGDSDEDENTPGPMSCRSELLPKAAPLSPGIETDGTMTNRRRKGMFLTHPPIGERKVVKDSATRSVDSNGLSSLRAGSDSVPKTGELTSQVSSTSLDSHICPTEGGEEGTTTYGDVVLHVMSEGNDVDKKERKNGKALKQKSKSDPSGEKQKLKEIPEKVSMPSAQSSPQLPESGQEDGAGGRSPDLRNQAVKEGMKSKSEDHLFAKKGGGLPRQHEHVVDEEGTKMSSEESQDDQPRVIQLAGRGRAFRGKKKLDKDKGKTGESDFGKDAIHEPVFNSQARSSPSTPQTQSPENTLKRPKISDQLYQPVQRNTPSVKRFHTFSGRPLPKRSPPDFSSTQDNSQVHRPGLTTPFLPRLDPLFPSGSTLSLLETPESEKEKRDMIVEELVSTEQQYVYTLKMLVEKYMIPLKKTPGIIDSHLVDDIFYKINEIYMHQAMFLAFLENALHKWDNANSTIGDVIHRTFSRDTVIENYTSFIENFPKAEKVLDELSTKGTFVRFTEQIERETRSKLPLKAQIVKPAQRIPRYELLLRRLIENTPKDHPDYPLLLGAEEAIHKMALQINAVKNSKHEEDLQETLRKLELLLVTELITPERLYHRYDLVQILNRKEQCSIWLFSDLAVFTSIKRKSGPVNRKSTILLQSPLGQDFVENVKHKVWLKIPLDDLDIIKGATLFAQKDLVDQDQLDEDFIFLNKIADLAAKLHTPHQGLDEAVDDLRTQINKQLSEHQLKSPPPDCCKVELMATTTEGVSNITVVFPSPEKKSSWEAAFMDIKQKLATLSNCRPPEFLQALQITKTRAGMQFSCASPIEGLNANQQRDVWVCNSDGYVGHMCLLSLQPEPIVTLNTPVPGCNSRILCICAVPAFHAPKRRVRKKSSSPRSPVTIRIESLDSGDAEDDEDEDEDGYGEDEEEDEDDSLSDCSSSTSEHAYSEGEESHTHQKQTCEGARASPMLMQPSTESLGATKENFRPDMTQKGTMWLGTEDGCIHIFLCTDNIKTTKNKIKVQQNAGILGMVQIDQRVFVSLANGDLVIYQRGKDGVWDMTNPETITLGSANSPITKMLPVAGRLWCACQSNIIILNTTTLIQEYEFSVNLESKRCIQCLACSGQGVWLSGQNSSKVLLYHATTYEYLLEVSIAQAVAQKLQTADDIIRQHKTACLRITSLLTCKDLLWVGTSAGVVLTLVMPKVTANTSRPNLSPPTVTGLVHGHTGHVRFLTSVEMSPIPGSPGKNLMTSKSALSRQEMRRASVSIHMLTLATKMLVISGGDGYEDFRNTSSNEAAGRDDSTNHLLLWQV